MTRVSPKNVNLGKLLVSLPKLVLYAIFLIFLHNKVNRNFPIFLVVNGGGATAYRNCYMANSDYCQSYAYSGVSMKDFCVIMYIVVMYMVFCRRKALLVTVPAIIAIPAIIVTVEKRKEIHLL